MSEDYPHATAAGLQSFVLESGLVALTEFAGNIQSQAGARSFGGKKGFEDLANMPIINTGAVVNHFQDGQFGLGVLMELQPDSARCAGCAAVAEGILAQVAEYLVELVGIHTGDDASFSNSHSMMSVLGLAS